jgi:xanthine dehydrogenase YagT iron-sulfur-binding subunit
MTHNPDPPPNGTPRPGVTRRSFIQTLGASAAATAIADQASAAIRTRPTADGPEILGPDPIEITLRINGKEARTKIDPTATLLEVLRLNLGLTGSKEICDRGSCGGCSILVDGRLVVSCMMLAVDAVGAEVTTIEGLEKNGKLDPVQEAFIKHDAMQCGYCTPGLVMATRWLLNEAPKPTLDEIKRYLSGNICRCGTYTNIFNAALEASGQPPIMDAKGA